MYEFRRSVALICTISAAFITVFAIIFSVAELEFPAVLLSAVALLAVLIGFIFAKSALNQEKAELRQIEKKLHPSNLAVKEAIEAYGSYQSLTDSFAHADLIRAAYNKALSAAEEMVLSLDSVSVSENTLALAALQRARDAILQAGQAEETLDSEQASKALQEKNGALLQCVLAMKQFTEKSDSPIK